MRNSPIEHTNKGARAMVIAKHPDASCTLDKFPGCEGFRVWVRVSRNHLQSGPAFKTPEEAWAEAAERLCACP